MELLRAEFLRNGPLNKNKHIGYMDFKIGEPLILTSFLTNRPRKPKVAGISRNFG
jgi:hypothetical protein